MRKTPSILTCLLLAAQTLACSPAIPDNPAAPVATVATVSAVAAAPGGSASATPMPGFAARPASTADGLTASLVGARRARFDRRFADSDTRDAIAALWSPDVVDFMPHAKGAPLDALMNRMLARYPDGMPAQIGASDAADIMRAILGNERRERERAEAEERYRAHFGDQPRALFVPPPTVDLVFRIENPTDEPLHVKVDGDEVTRRMRLVGPGAEHARGGGDLTEIYKCGAWVTIAPRGHHDVPVTQLTYGHRAAELGAYWTQPGDYALQMSLRTTVARGAEAPDSCARGTTVELVAPAFALEVG